MNAPSRQPLWWEGASSSPRPALGSDLDVDVCIVGGGFSGLWTARELLRRDPSLRVAVVEARTCGFGASGRNGGWASALFPAPAEHVLDLVGAAGERHLTATLRAAVGDLGAALAHDGVDAHFRHGGTITFATTDAQRHRLRLEVEAAHQRGDKDSDIAWLSASELAERHGQVAGQEGGIFDAHCAAIHPFLAVTGLADAVERSGAQIFENSPVTRITPARGHRRAAAVTVAGTVRADIVVRATEGFSTQFTSARRDLVPLYSLMVATEPQSEEFWAAHGLAQGETFADGRHLIIYGQRTLDNRLAFGGRGAPYHFGSAVEPRFDHSPTVTNLLGESLRQLFPTLSGELTHSWGGPLAMPRNHLPFVTLDHERGLAALGGYTGDGVVMRYLAGRSLAALIAGDADDVLDVQRLAFVQRPPQKWEVEPVRWLGINMGLWLATRADAREQATGSPAPYDRWLERLLG